MAAKTIRFLLIASITFIIITYIGSVARREFERGYMQGTIDTYKRTTPTVDPNRKILV